MPAPVKSVAVIGAGPAGAIVTDALVKEQVFETIKVFERRPAIGGAWFYTPHLPGQIPSLRELLEGSADKPVSIPTRLPAETPKSTAVNSHQTRFSDTPLHENLHSNIIPSIMSYTQHPFPETTSQRLIDKYGPKSPFLEHSLIRDWVEGIFTKNGNDKLVSLNTTVERAEKEGGKWVLTLRKEGPVSNYWWQETFDALVVAGGHYSVPWFPNIPGLVEYDARYPGRIIHSKHFRNAASFKNKRIIVLGGSVSSSEIIHEILPYAQHPVIGSLRGDPIPAFGFIPWTHPHIVVKRHITSLDPATGRVTFSDGSSVDDIDHVIFGTGYTFSFPYLPDVQKKVKQANRRLPGVYQHTWNIDDPTLVFVGMLGGGFTFRAYEWQAVAVARHLAGRAKALPSVEDQKAWEAKRVAQFGGGKAYYSIAPNYEEFFEFLRDIAGPPVAGTAGRVLPPFDKSWMDVWAGMVAPKIKAWQRAKAEADEQDRKALRAKL